MEDIASLAAVLTPGSELSCTTTQGDVLRGNVVATDEAVGVVVIKEEGDDATSATGNIHIINLKHISDLDVLSRAPESLSPPPPPPPLPDISLAKVQRRMDQNISAKWKEVEARGVNVTEDAQLLFDNFKKLYSDIRWEGEVIVLLGDVRISPPYLPEHCIGSSGVDRIKKLVEKFHSDRKSL